MFARNPNIGPEYMIARLGKTLSAQLCEAAREGLAEL